MKRAALIIGLLVFAAVLSGCKKEVETSSTTDTVESTVEQTPVTTEETIDTYVDANLLEEDDFVEIGEMV